MSKALKRTFVRGLLAAFSCAFSLSSTRAQPPNIVAKIDPTKVLVDNFQGWGTSLCWWANVVGGYSNRNDYADLAFRILKLNIVRYNIGGGENPKGPSGLSFREKVPGFEPSRNVWNWSADKNQRWMLKAALARGVNHVEAFANSPPYWMTVSGSVTGARGGANNLLAPCERDFAIYLAESVQHLSQLDGVKFHSISPLNEPSANWWKLGGHQEGCHIGVAQQDRLINLLRGELDSRGLNLPIDASEDNDEQSTIDALRAYTPAGRDHVGQIATHTYGANNAGGLKALASLLRKPLWHTEYGDNDATGMTTARRIRDDLVHLRPLTWCYWQVVDNGGGWGLLYNPLNQDGSTAYRINRKFYAFGQFTKFLHPGCQIIDCGDTNSVAGYNSREASLAIVTVNDGAADFTETFDLGDFGRTGRTVQCYRTSPSEKLKHIGSFVVADQKYHCLVPAHSVTTCVLRQVIIKKAN